MGEVIRINQKRLFTLEEAQSLLPVVRRITKDAQERVNELNIQLGYLQDSDRKSAIEDEIYCILQDWQKKLRKLGCVVKGMWLVDFDSGDGYYCWKYPESKVNHFHGYTDGFSSRVELH